MMPVTPRGHAFTLIEVLLAMSLSAILIGAVYWTLAAGFDAHGHARRIIAFPRAAEFALETLRADLQGAVEPGGLLTAEFIGGEAAGAEGGVALIFYTAAGTSGEPRTAGVRRVEWVLGPPLIEPTADEHSALLRRVTDNLLAPVVPDPVEQTIATDVLELGLRFYDGSEWQNEWDSVAQSNALPLAVELTLTLAMPESREAEARDSSEPDRSYIVRRVIALPAGATDAEGRLAR